MNRCRTHGTITGEFMASSQPKRFGVLGSGEVGQTLAKGLAANGYEARIGSRSPAKLAQFSKIAAWGDAAVLAVLGTAALEVSQQSNPTNLRGKLVIDTTNPISNEAPV